MHVCISLSNIPDLGCAQRQRGARELGWIHVSTGNRFNDLEGEHRAVRLAATQWVGGKERQIRNISTHNYTELLETKRTHLPSRGNDDNIQCQTDVTQHNMPTYYINFNPRHGTTNTGISDVAHLPTVRRLFEFAFAHKYTRHHQMPRICPA